MSRTTGIAVGFLGVIGFIVSLVWFQSFEIGMVFMLLSLVGGVFFALRKNDNRNDEMRELAALLEMDFIEGEAASADGMRPLKSRYFLSFILFGWVIAGIRKGLAVRIYHYIYGNAGNYTGIQVQYKIKNITNIFIANRNVSLPMTALERQVEKIQTGDPIFDNTAVVAGDHGAKKILSDPEIRAVIIAAIRLGSVEFHADGVYYEEPGLNADKDRFLYVVDVLTAAAEHLNAA